MGAVREDLLDLVRRGGGRDDRVGIVSQGLRKINRADRACSGEGL